MRRFAAILGSLVLIATGLVLLSAPPASATCTATRQHVTGTDGLDYLISPRPINGGNACLTIGTGASYTVTSQTTAERADHKVLSYPDALFGCQWGGTNNVDLDCTTGFSTWELQAQCFYTTNCTGGVQWSCKVYTWSSDLSGAEAGTNTDVGFDLWAGSAATPDWAHTNTEIFVNTHPDTALGTGYTSWPSVTINGQNFYYNDQTGAHGAWSGDFVQYIRHTNKDTFSNYDL